MKITNLTNESKPIEFMYFLGRNGDLVKETAPNVLENADEVILLSKDKYINGQYYDFIFVKYKKGGPWEDTFYLGKWNDGNLNKLKLSGIMLN